jgi:hypothetical protein
MGFYGGVNYGYGYAGVGYQGGYWDRGEFRYNRAVNNINATNITNVYNTTVIQSIASNRVSYNGGVGGIHLQSTPDEQYAVRLPHMGPTAMQVQHQLVAIANPMQLVSFNHGLPRVAATPAPGAFNFPNTVSADATRNQPAQRLYGRAAQYQQTAQPPQPVLHPQFQQQLMQPERPPERYAPQQGGHQQAVLRAQPMAIPAQHEVTRPLPITSPQQNVRLAPQEYRNQQAILRSPPVERPAPAEALHTRSAMAMQPRQNEPHQGRSNEKEYRER